MNILVLNGSPHEKGNTTALVDAFCQGAKSSNHKVTVIQVGTKKISGCIACEHCHTKGAEKCIQVLSHGPGKGGKMCADSEFVGF